MSAAGATVQTRIDTEPHQYDGSVWRRWTLSAAGAVVAQGLAPTPALAEARARAALDTLTHDQPGHYEPAEVVHSPIFDAAHRRYTYRWHNLAWSQQMLTMLALRLDRDDDRGVDPAEVCQRIYSRASAAGCLPALLLLVDALYDLPGGGPDGA